MSTVCEQTPDFTHCPMWTWMIRKMNWMFARLTKWKIINNKVCRKTISLFFYFFDCHCNDIRRWEAVCLFFFWKVGRSWGVCADTKLVAIEGLLISMTLSMLMMRNFSRNLNIINFLFSYREALLPLLCCCCCCCVCWWCCWHFFCYCCRGYLSIFAVNMWTHKFVTLTWQVNRVRQRQHD